MTALVNGFEKVLVTVLAYWNNVITDFSFRQGSRLPLRTFAFGLSLLTSQVFAGNDATDVSNARTIGSPLK
ncbi:hypothetical protein [Amycolatopsis pigmentata]|uniref:Uncharacterized protein n=1 Tax=Amycolatopsis pigmentata TaxID=450801 RepID=A0ABW5FML8_9PSEU